MTLDTFMRFDGSRIKNFITGGNVVKDAEDEGMFKAEEAGGRPMGLFPLSPPPKPKKERRISITFPRGGNAEVISLGPGRGGFASSSLLSGAPPPAMHAEYTRTPENPSVADALLLSPRVLPPLAAR